LKIKRRLLDIGFVVRTKTIRQTNELLIELDRVGYNWNEGQALRESAHFGLLGGNRAYHVRLCCGKKVVSEASASFYARRGYDIYTFEGILDKNFLYGEV